MRLTFLRLYNFRQFFGEAKLDLSPKSGERNVVVIHGSNGAGKTALLNAFTWALYGQTTRGFQLPEQVINKRALRSAEAGEVVDAWVEVGFEHDDRQYILRRTTAGDGKTTARLLWCGDDGQWKDQSRVADAIGRILPADLHQYFFFDGERIERVVQPDREEQRALSNATKKLLGTEVLLRAENHVNSVRRDLEKELQNVGDPIVQQLLRKKRSQEAELDKLQESIAEIEHNIEEHKKFKAAVEEKLRQVDEVKSIQARREQLQSEEEGRKQAVKGMLQDLADVISTGAFAVFLSGAVEAFRSNYEHLRQRGELPAGVKRQFVDDLLEQQECICGRRLDADTEERRAVEEWRGRAGFADVEEKAILVFGKLDGLERTVADARERLENIQARRGSVREEIARIQGELYTIRERLKNSPKEEISGLETRRTEIEEYLAAAHRKAGAARAGVHVLEEDIRGVERDLEKQQVVEKKQRFARECVLSAIDARDRIRGVRARLEDKLRRMLGDVVSQVFARMSVTPYVPDVGEDFGLCLRESSGGRPLAVAASQGESQILSLAFIAGIVGSAKRMRAEKGTVAWTRKRHISDCYGFTIWKS